MGRRRRGVMSEQLKYELAKDLGFYDTVQKEGWGSIRAKDAGNMVKRAVQIAERMLAAQAQTQPPVSAPVGVATMNAMAAPAIRPSYVASVYQPQRYKP
jgi:small acid-soluble spore protein F (minor alpha/beta-type SASP)